MMSWQVIIVVTNEQISSIYQFEKNRICSLSNESEFGQYLWNYYQFVSWAKWYPDLYIQLFKKQR